MAFAPLLDQPATWGLAGAFIFSAPQWIACLVACRQAKQPTWRCSLEFAVALATGGIAAAAFTGVILAMSPIKDHNAIAATIGLLANSTAPLLVKHASKLAALRLTSKILPGEDP